MSGDETPYEINPGLVKQKAKELYLLYYWTAKQLSEHLGIPEGSVRTWIDKPTEGKLSWRQERDVFEQSTFKAMKERASDEMSKSLSRAMSILNRSLTEADLEGMRLKSPRDYKEMVNVVQTLKNLVNVEEGKPTSIKAHAALTQEDVRELVKELQDLDPFMDYDPSGSIN